jgi:diacylglycerol kinase (ATP)
MSKLNKPKYSLWGNTSYALEGLVDLIKNETSFRLQLLALVVFSIVAVFLPVSIVTKAVLWFSLWIPPIAEVINSAIERVVDLVTTEYHIMAKRAKDVGASLVFISILFTLSIWTVTLLIEFQLI